MYVFIIFAMHSGPGDPEKWPKVTFGIGEKAISHHYLDMLMNV